MSGAFKRSRPDGPGLLTTTCRFDADLLGQIAAEAERLGISNSEVIRALVREGLARRAGETSMQSGLAKHEERIARLERLVKALADKQLQRG